MRTLDETKLRLRKSLCHTANATSERAWASLTQRERLWARTHAHTFNTAVLGASGCRDEEDRLQDGRDVGDAVVFQALLRSVHRQTNARVRALLEAAATCAAAWATRQRLPPPPLLTLDPEFDHNSEREVWPTEVLEYAASVQGAVERDLAARLAQGLYSRARQRGGGN